MFPGTQLIFKGSNIPFAPYDMFAGLGKNGQIVSVSRSKGLVVVRMGNEPKTPASEISTVFCDQIWEKLNEIMEISTVSNQPTSLHPMVFPNPSGKTIAISGISGIVTMIDIQGKHVWQGNVEDGQTIDISKFKPGIYFLKTNKTTIKFLIANHWKAIFPSSSFRDHGS